MLNKNVFSLNKICCITFRIKPTGNESSSWSPTVFSWNYDKVSFLLRFRLCRHMEWANENISKNAWNSEWRVFNTLELAQEIVIKWIMTQVINAIWVLFFKLHIVLVRQVVLHTSWGILRLDLGHGGLKILCEINIIWKIERFLILNFLNHINIFNIFTAWL